MKANVLTLRERYEELGAKLSHPDALKDQNLYKQLTRDHSRVRKQLEIGERYLDLIQQVEDSRELLKGEHDPDMAEMIREELAAIEPRLEQATVDLEAALLPHDPNDDRDAILEVRAGVKGEGAVAIVSDAAFRRLGGDRVA